MSKKRYTAEEKVRILREHLDNNLSISELAEKYSLNPSVIRYWKKELFEGAMEIFSGKRNRKTKKSKESQLEEKISSMQEVITELTTENVKLRKKSIGAI